MRKIDTTERTPGWDAKEITRIAVEKFGSFTEMFTALGWPERGRHMMPAVQRRVVEEYGSVERFVTTHDERETGTAANVNRGTATP